MNPAIAEADAPKGRVRPGGLVLRDRHVHPVDAGQKGQRDEDRADDGQHLHDLVHPVRDHRDMGLGHRRGNLAVGLDEVDDLHAVVVDIAEVGLGNLRQALVAFPLELCDQLAHGPGDTADHHQVALDQVDGLEVLGLRPRQYILLGLLQLCRGLVEDREEAVDDGSRAGSIGGSSRRSLAGASVGFRSAGALPPGHCTGSAGSSTGYCGRGRC